jgi:hypothetical protein
MALQGVFNADFTKFTDACAAAEASLKGFETGANQTEAALNRMADSVSGQKIVQQAFLATKAVEDIGGASVLTEKELAKMSAIAAEGAEKLTKMGQDVPPSMQRLANETKGVTTAQEALGSVVDQVGASLIAMFSVSAAVGFVERIAASASALNTLSQQTHVNVEDLQLLSGALSEFGVSSEELGHAMFNLSKGIAGGDESVAHALALMGLSLKDVAGLDTTERLIVMEGALAKLQGGLRDTAAAEAFGSKLGAAMAGASAGFESALGHAREFNTVMSAESVKSLDEFNTAIARAQTNLSNMAANMIGPVAQGFNVLVDAAEKGASKWELLGAMYTDWIAKNTGLGTGTENLTRLLVAQQKEVDLTAVKTAALAASHTQVAGAVDTRTAAERFLAALEANAAKDLNDTQIRNLEHLRDIGQLNAKNAEGVGVTAAEYEKYKTQLELATTAATKLHQEEVEAAQAAKKAVEDLAAASITAYTNQIAGLKDMEAARLKAYGTDEQIAMLQRLGVEEDNLTRHVLSQLNTEKDRQKVIADAAKDRMNLTQQIEALELKKAGTVNEAVVKELEAQQRLNAGYKGQQTAIETLNSALAALHTEKREGISQTAQETELYNQYTKALYDDAVAQDRDRDALAKKNDERDKEISKLNTATQAMQTYQGGTKLTGSTVASEFGQSYILSPTGARVPMGPHGEVPKNFDDLYSGKSSFPQFAGGVSNFSGGLAIVGERGPELVNLPGGSSVIPNGGAGGTSITNVFNITAPLGTPDAIARAVAEAQIGLLRTQGVRLPYGT